MDGPEAEVRLGATHRLGEVPAFRVAERDRSALGLEADWRPTHAVRLDARLDGRRDVTPAGGVSMGPGDLRLGTEVRLADRPIRPGVVWRAKVPTAADEAEIGTDETDVTLGLVGVAERGPYTVGAEISLDILGNPLRFANQDDVPHAVLHATGTFTQLSAWALVDAGLATSRNPARAHLRAGLESPGAAFVGVEGLVGLSAASADWGLGLHWGVRWDCPRARCD